jgi:ABC-type sugar transport system substrate-binding protein
MTRTKKFGIPAIGAITAVAVVGLALAGCSPAGGRAADSTSTVSAAGGLADASAFLEPYRHRPTEITNNKPISAPIPTGLTAVFINTTGAALSNLQGAIFTEAVQMLGWNAQVVNTDGTPESVKNAWRELVRTKPDVVMYVALDRAGFEREIQELSAGGTYIGSLGTADPAGNGLAFANVTVEEYATKLGEVLAAMGAKQSGGRGEVLVLNLPEYAVIGKLADSIKANMPRFCPDCSVETLDVPLSALGKDVPQRIVSFLRSHPEAKTVVSGLDDLVIGLPAALSAANLNDIKVLSQSPNPTSFGYIANGSVSEAVSFPVFETMYAQVDNAARAKAGEDLVPSEYYYWILDQDNLPADHANLFPVVENVKEHYAGLWGK